MGDKNNKRNLERLSWQNPFFPPVPTSFTQERKQSRSDLENGSPESPLLTCLSGLL